MSLSRKELEDMRPMVANSVQKFLGFGEDTLVTASLNCIDKGYDRRKTIGKLGPCGSLASVQGFPGQVHQL